MPCISELKYGTTLEYSKYISGIVKIESTVVCKTTIEAVSASPPNFVAKSAVDAAAGIELVKNKTAFNVLEIGNNIQIIIDRTETKISFVKLAKYAYLSVKSLVNLTLEIFKPITNIPSGVTRFAKVSHTPTKASKILSKVEP